jgi:2-hydroxychromene-2-carboxylate isomerase
MALRFLPASRAKGERMAHIDYFFATLSPYVYLAGQRLEQIAAETGATISYKPLDIIALFERTGGTPPAQRHPNRMAWRAQELPRQAKKAGMPFNLKPAHWPTNGAPASYAIIAAQKTGGGDLGKLVSSISSACWAEEKDIADDAVIRACLEGAGFDPNLVDSGLLVGAETYARNLDEAVERGAFGAPTYITDSGQLFWGQDRLDDLRAHLKGEL